MTNYCTLEELKADAGITTNEFDAFLTVLAEAISDVIDDECNRGGRLYYRQATEFFDVEHNQKRFFPKNTPVISAFGHYIRNDDEYTELDTQLFVYPEYIELEYPLYANSQRNIYIGDEYFFQRINKGLKTILDVGFFEETAIPAGLNMLARDLAIKSFKQSREIVEGGIKSKKIGNYAVTYKDRSAIEDESKTSLQNSPMYSVLKKYQKALIY